jgi:hypothetical protein
MICDVVIDR